MARVYAQRMRMVRYWSIRVMCVLWILMLGAVLEASLSVLGFFCVVKCSQHGSKFGIFGVYQDVLEVLVSQIHSKPLSREWGIFFIAFLASWSCLGGLLKPFWAVLGRKKLPTCVQIGFQNGTKIHKKLVEQSINFLIPFEITIYSFFFRFE